MLTWIMIAVVCSAVFHAGLELRGKLDDYLGEVVGFISPWWLKYALFVLALLLILVPLGLGFFQILRGFFFAEAAGALLGDTFSTHLVPIGAAWQTDHHPRHGPGSYIYHLESPYWLTCALTIPPLWLGSL